MEKERLVGFNWIKAYQDRFYPGWLENKPRLLYSTGLAGEVGEVCGVVTHLDGGGTNNKKYTKEMLLHQCVDAYIQLILLIQKSGFSHTDFLLEFEQVKFELEYRLKEKASN
jgi:hypothetical protein